MNACTPEELHCKALTHNETVGFFAATLAPLASFIAVVWLLSRILVNVVRRVRRSENWRLIEKPIEVYLLSLFVADLIEAFSDCLNLRWIIQGKVWVNSYCKAQGVIITVGETAMSLNCLAIAIHTFFTVVWRIGLRSLRVPCLVIGAIWAFVILFPLILYASTSTRRHELFVPNPYWCWINETLYLPFKIATFYVWLWLAILFSFICYVPLFLWRLGYISFNGGDFRWEFHVHRESVVAAGASRSVDLILYPIALSILGFPGSVVRFLAFTGHKVPGGGSLAVAAIIDLSGLFNVLLFIYTRQGLFLFDEDSVPGEIIVLP